MTSDQIAIASYNCNGLADSKKRREIFTWLKKKDYQIFCLQETHSKPVDENKWMKEWDGPIHFSHGSSNSKGVMIIFKKHFDFVITSINSDPNGRWIIMYLVVEAKNIIIVNLYAPNTDDPVFFEGICDLIQRSEQPHDYICIVGDFNTVLNINKDRSGNQTSNYHRQALEAIQKLMDTLDLVDVWRHSNPNATRYTWRRSRQASRIDYFLTSFSMLTLIKKTDIEERFRSDHNLISLHLTINEYPRGPGYWKFNQTLLTDQDFVTKAEDFITEFFEVNTGSAADPLNEWDAFKCAFRGFSIAFASRKLKLFRRQENELLNEIKDLTAKLDNGYDVTIETSLEDKQRLLEQLIQEKATNTYYRSGADWMEKGNKCTKYFLKMQQRNATKKNVSKLIKSTGESITSPDEIINHQTKYFKEIFSFQNTPSPIDSSSILFPENNLNRLSEQQSNSCEGPITEEELRIAVNSFKTGKSPGIDGLPIEIYKTFFECLKSPLLRTFQYSYEKGQLTDTQRVSLISLLLKQEPNGQYKDPTNLKNWRPLALQGCDAKLLSKCIAIRMEKVLSTIIHENQSGFLKGRYIGDNLRQLMEIIEHYDKSQEPGLIFVADLEKAFDKLSHDFIFKTLSYYNFGHSFIRWVKVLNKHTSCKIINNGYISESVSLERGVKQGCPLSPYLFIAAIEILASKVRSNTRIRGLNIQGLNEKVSMYADDTNFFLSPNVDSLKALTNDLDLFSTMSGLNPNYAKCTVLRIGSLKGTPFSIPSPLPLKWSDGPVDVLGIHIPVNFKEIMAVNFYNKLRKVDKVLQPWRGKPLTIYGKIALINSLVVSQFTYILMSLPSPTQDLFKLYESTVFKFIWNGKPEKIKRTFIYNDKENGGFGLLNLEALNFSLKANLIPKLYLNPNWFSSKLLGKIHPLFSNRLYPHLQLPPEKFKALNDIVGTSTFLSDALQKWLWFQYYPPERSEDILQQIIWFNANILIQGKPIYWDNLVKKHILFINDILHDDGEIMSHQQFSELYGEICPRHKYNQLIAALPKDWKCKIKTSPQQIIVSKPHMKKYHWLAGIKLNKPIYNFFMWTKPLLATPFTMFEKWESLIDCPLPWNKIFNLIYITTPDAESRYFQIKLLYNFLATKKMLTIWQIEQCNLCRFCQDEPESSDHLFWYCPLVAQFWSQVERHLSKRNHLNLDLRKVIFGDLEEANGLLNNIIILLGKIFIFRQKSEQSLRIDNFKKLLKHMFKMEAIIATNNGKEQYLLWRWEAVSQEEVLEYLA